MVIRGGVMSNPGIIVLAGIEFSSMWGRCLHQHEFPSIHPPPPAGHLGIRPVGWVTSVWERSLPRPDSLSGLGW